MPKRGRYGENTYMGNRNVAQGQMAPPPMPNLQNYGPPSSHGNAHSFPPDQQYTQQQQHDQYQHTGYNGSMQAQGNYPVNGSYSQSYNAPSSQMGYSSDGYDHSATGYQDYG